MIYDKNRLMHWKKMYSNSLLLNKRIMRYHCEDNFEVLFKL